VGRVTRIAVITIPIFKPEERNHSGHTSIHKRMVRFQELLKNIFLTLYWHDIHYQQRELSTFHMR
jgi:hypothetical protein